MLTVGLVPGVPIAVLCFLIAGPATASTSDELKALREEVGNIRQAQRQMQQDRHDPDIVHLTKFFRGAQSLQVFSAAIDELLNTAAPGNQAARGFGRSGSRAGCLPPGSVDCDTEFVQAIHGPVLRIDRRGR